MRIVGLILLALMLVTTSGVHAKKKRVVYKKRTVLDFDGTLIEGELTNPESFYYVHRNPQKFGSLVKKRKNFHKEVLRDSLMIP